MIQRNLLHAHYHNLFRPCTYDQNITLVPRLSRTDFITRLFYHSMIKDLPWKIFVSKMNQPPVSSAVCVQHKRSRLCLTTEADGCDSDQSVLSAYKPRQHSCCFTFLLRDSFTFNFPLTYMYAVTPLAQLYNLFPCFCVPSCRLPLLSKFLNVWLKTFWEKGPNY